MHKLNQEEFAALSKLCRIKCSQEEEKILSSNVSKILSYIELLKELDTKDVPPFSLIKEGFTNVMREDVALTSLSREEFLENVPSHVDGMVKVPPFLNPEKDS